MPIETVCLYRVWGHGVTKLYKSIRFGDIHGHKATESLQAASDEVAEHCKRNFKLKFLNFKRKFYDSD